MLPLTGRAHRLDQLTGLIPANRLIRDHLRDLSLRSRIGRYKVVYRPEPRLKEAYFRFAGDYRPERTSRFTQRPIMGASSGTSTTWRLSSRWVPGRQPTLTHSSRCNPT